MATNRHDFSEKTKRQIGMRAGWLCSFPTCPKTTIGATSDGDSEINIGTAAHICAAAPGGPRYDVKMSQEDRSSAQNGIWMCRDHGKAIDSNDPEFTVKRLLEWKRQAEIRSWRRVLGMDPSHGSAVGVSSQLTVDLRAAAGTDLEVFRRTVKWPPTSVALMLDLEGFDEPVSTSALATAVASLDDLILVAGPGTGKTTTLFQIAEGILVNGSGAPLVMPLGDWATENTTIVESILRRPAFHGISEAKFREAASHPGIVLLLDGWNELDARTRSRARVEISRLKAELPHLGLVVSTRRQALDCPFEGTRVDILPLSEDQQMQMAVAMRGEAGARIIDQAWRTPGLRELVTIPLYLTALMSLPENAPFPTTKEEVLRRFVSAQEKEAGRAEVLYAEMQGLQQHYLEGVAVVATHAANTAIADDNGRRSIVETEARLAKEGQIKVGLQPDKVLDVLVSHHVLTRMGDTPGYSFQHQQFQEWYASHSVERLVMAAVTGTEARESLKAEVFNLPAWEEAILFAVERLAHGGANQRAACGKAIVTAFEVDPILAAEMICRSTEDVWAPIASTVQDFIERWHSSGKVDRAVRFMLTSGRPEFINAVWPLITADEQQISLRALRNVRRFRVSILGNNAEKRIRSLAPKQRALLLHEIAMHGGMDGLDLATTVAKNDADVEVQFSVVSALAFRRADRHVADTLREASDQTFDKISRFGLLEDVRDENVRTGLEKAQKRLKLKGEPIANRLRLIVNERSADHSKELTQIISTMNFEQQSDPNLHLVFEAHSRYPQAVVDGLLSRVFDGSNLFHGADDMLASTGLTLEDEALVDLALHDLTRPSIRAAAAASVLGPGAVGRLVEEWLAIGSRLSEKYDEATSNLYHELERRIAHVPGPSLVAAVVVRSAWLDNGQMEVFANLLSRHPRQESERGRPLDAASVLAVQALVEDWGAQMLASADANRRQKLSIAQLASSVPSISMLPIMRRLLDDNLQRYRSALATAKGSNWQAGKAVDETHWPRTHEYRQAFLAIEGSETTAMMREYLTDEDFGEHAAQVLAIQWHRANEPPTDNRFRGGVDFSDVKTKRARIADNPDWTTPEAEAIFDVIGPLIADGATDSQKKLGVKLGVVASRLPHGRRHETINNLIQLAPRETRAAMLRALVFSGEEIDTNLVVDGIAATFKAAEKEKWILTDNDAYQLKDWLRLLPFGKNPAEALTVVRGLPAAHRDPYFLEEMVAAFFDSPSNEAEDVLFALADEDERFYSNYRWQTTVRGFGTPSSIRRFMDLTARGAFENSSTDQWHFAIELGNALDDHPGLRAHAYELLKDGPTSPGLMTLARAVAENPDEEGLLLLVKFKKAGNRQLIGQQTIKRSVTEDVPSKNWKGASEIVPFPADSLRKKLFELSNDTDLADEAVFCLRQIDWIRDEYGRPEGEPRHPDLASGRPWPILGPDRDPAIGTKGD